MESSECNLLKLKMQRLEQEKVELLKSIETERELFNRIMAEHKELKVKEERIKELEGVNESLTAKLVQFKQYLENKEETIVKLHKVSLICHFFDTNCVCCVFKYFKKVVVLNNYSGWSR